VAGESASGRVGRLLAGLTPGAVVAGYQLESRIGAGGMAVVFRARDERLGRTVALKVLAPTLAGDGEFRERFIRESRAAAAVDHPHIIPVYGAGEADGILYLAMRYASGGDLRSVMYREGPLPAERAAFLLSPVASALDAAHAAGLVHRDVKPANVLVDTSPGRPDHLYLSDFGLAKGATSMTGLTGTGQFLGTADYAAPEQISGGRAHVQTDQYALACVAFTLLTGALPFARNEPMAVLWAHLNDPPPSATAHRFDLSPAVDQVLGRALAKNPAARYPSCGAFADALRAALGVGPYSVPTPAYPGHPARGGAPMPTPGAPTARSALGPLGWAAVTGARAPVAGGPVTGGTDNGAAVAGAPRLPLKPGGRRRGALAAASAVAVLAGAAVVVAVLFHPGSDKPHQISGGNPGGQVTGRADSPEGSASATGEAA
jgi:serine/threonine protein kinase